MTAFNFDDPYELAEWVYQKVMRALENDRERRMVQDFDITDYDIREVDRQVNSFVMSDSIEARHKRKELEECVSRYGAASIMDFCSITGARPDNAREEELFKRIGWTSVDDILGVRYDYEKGGYIIKMAKIKRLKGDNDGRSERTITYGK